VKKRDVMTEEKFEQALERLEGIVSKLEDGDLDLEESLKLFEEGIRLSHFCSQKLDEAERKVEILLKNREGTLGSRPFMPEEGKEGTEEDL
jgi:exodeoxyribonuclease VII small subunit